MRSLRQALPLLALLASTLALASCGEKSEEVTGEADSLTVALDFYPNPDHAGIYLAEERGYFREAGLDIAIETPADPSAPIKHAAAGRVDLAISYEPEVVLAHEQGLDVVAVAALVSRPLTSMIWLRESKIGGIADLRGRTIATAGIPYQDAFLETILARGGLKPSDVRTVNVGFSLLPALISGRADAMLGGFRNVEGVDLRLRGKEPTVTPVDELGVPTYDELVLVASRETAEERGDALRLFIAALERGTRAAAADPDAATHAVLRANDALDPELTAAEMRATVPLLQPEPGRAYGFMDEAEWSEFIGWMRDNELIDSLPRPAAVLTNDYVAGRIAE